MYLFTGEKKDCCGCMACVPACPVNCIAVTVDEEGFEYPVRDAARCTDCGKCTAVCPVMNKPAPTPTEGSPAAYAAWSRDENTRRESSSGGVFPELAKQFLREGGVVFGAAFRDDFHAVHHVAIEDVAQLPRLQGSKYVQSSTVGVFPQVKELLDAGRTVFFSGTPCQVAGLYNFIGADIEGLTTCDLVCHGVPSPGVFEKYMEEQEQKYGAKTIAYLFRDKRAGWNFKEVRQIFENGKTRQSIDWEDPFSSGFLNAVLLRPICYRCPFYPLPRIADITLADYWGVATKYPQYDDDKGTSLVLIHTKKGRENLHAGNALIIHQTDIAHGIAHNAHLNHPAAAPACRKDFFAAFRDGSFCEAAGIYMKNSDVMKRKFRRLAKRAVWRLKSFIK